MSPVRLAPPTSGLLPFDDLAADNDLSHHGGPMTLPPARRYIRKKEATMTDNTLTTCLWFNTEAEEAATFYTGVFKDSRLGRVHRHTDAGPGPAGSVMLVEFELNGQKFSALNGGPQFTFNESVSIVVPCADQAEVDYYWSSLSQGGQEVACGWLKDKYGLSWQIVPARFFELVSDADPQKAGRVMQAMLGMTKFDIAALERAYAGA
jgi:predicted 3-demethylubiquinone-9 3-methyltransferase (glyoxalase superfamily)